MEAPHRGVDRGESLLEILLSIMIIGIAVTAIIGGVGIAAKASTQDERQIHAQALLRSWAEHIQAQSTDVDYPTCATDYTLAPRWYTSPTPPVGLEALPADFTAGIEKVQYWNGGAFVDRSDPSDPCSTDRNLQRVTLTMTVDAGLYPGFTSEYDVVVRRPCAALAGSGGPGC